MTRKYAGGVRDIFIIREKKAKSGDAMAGYYSIKQGDHLASIAKEFGFSDYRTIWNDPHNTELNNKRQNPNVLFSGDLLYIPDLKLREETRKTDTRHIFVAHQPIVKLRLILEDLFEKPIAHAQCDLRLENTILKLTTDDKGQIEQQIRPDTHNAFLIIKDAQTPFENIEIPIRIGYLDPEEEVSGQMARLNNLGYFAGGDAYNSDPDQLRSAIEEFQCDHRLTVDGLCGPITQARLKHVHGC